MFVDVEEGGVDVEEIVATFQELPHRLTDTRYLIIRWPDVTGAGADEADYDAHCQAWADTIAERSSAVGYGQLHTGVVRFRVGAGPRLAPPVSAPTGHRRGVEGRWGSDNAGAPDGTGPARRARRGGG